MPCERPSRRRSAPSPGSTSSSRAISTSRCFRRAIVSFHDVGLKGGGTSDPALHVDVLTANLRLLPLLLRRFEIADVMMLRPTIHRGARRHGESNWTPFVDTIARTMKPGAGEPGLVLGNPHPGRHPQLSRCGRRGHRKTRRHRPVAGLAVDLALLCRDRRSSTGAANASTARSAPAISSALLSGERSGLKARLVSAPLKLAFDGTVANRTSLMMEGTCHDRLALAAQRAALDRPAAAGRRRLRPLRAEGARQRGRRIGGADQRQCRARRQRRRRRDDLQQRAAARPCRRRSPPAMLDFTPYISTFRMLAGGQRDWNRQLFDLDALSATDLDMRLSAAKVTVGATQARPHRARRQLARRRAGAQRRRSADVWRHRQGLVRDRALRRGWPT